MTRGEILSRRIILLASRLVDGEAPDLEMTLTLAATRGMATSAHTVIQRHERRFATLEALLAERIKLEREYPMAPEDSEAWEFAVSTTIFEIIAAQEQRLYEALEADSRRLLGVSSEPFKADIEAKINRLRLQYINEIEIIKGEREHRMRIPATMPTNITLNINQSQIAALNVAGTVGTLQANLTALQSTGEEKLAEALKALAEAIAQEPTLTDVAKRDALEYASGIGEEFAKPKKEWRPAVMRALASSLASLVGHAGKVYELYEIVRTVAKASGYELP